MLYRRKMPTQMCALISFAVLIYLLFHKGVIDSGRNESYLGDETVTESITTSTLEPTTPVNCSILRAPANGSVSYPTGRLKDGLGVYACDDPCYGLGGGTNVRTCQSDGQWNGTEPFCSLVDEEYYIGFRNSCYMFDSVSRISWFDARETCGNSSAKLIEIESEEEQMFIEGHLNSSVRFWWIGGQDLDLEFIFEWDSTGLKRPDWLYDNFYRNEPNFLTVEHCMVLWRDKGYQWGNDRCGIPRLHAYICEMET